MCFLCGRFARTCRAVCETSRAHETKARLRFANHKTAHKLRVCVYCFGVCTNKLGAHGSHAHTHALFAHDVNALPMLRSQVCIVCACFASFRRQQNTSPPPQPAPIKHHSRMPACTRNRKKSMCYLRALVRHITMTLPCARRVARAPRCKHVFFVTNILAQHRATQQILSLPVCACDHPYCRTITRVDLTDYHFCKPNERARVDV